MRGVRSAHELGESSSLFAFPDEQQSYHYASV